MPALARGIGFLIGIGFMLFGLLVTMVYIEEIPNLTLRELELLNRPYLWDQYLGMILGVAFMIQGVAIDFLSLFCFREEHLRRKVLTQKRINSRRSTGRLRHLLASR